MKDSTTQLKPTAQSKKHSDRKKQWIIVAIFVILFFGGAVGSWLFISLQKPAQNTIQKKEADLVQSERSKEVNRVTAKAEKLALNGKTEDAKVVYDNAIEQTPDTYQKTILLLSKADLSLNNNDYDSALAIAKQAEAINLNSLVTQYIAQIYEAKGDAPKAIEYYQKTIPLIDKSKPLADADIKYYQSRIEALKGANN